MSSRKDSNHARVRVLRVSSGSLLIETSGPPLGHGHPAVTCGHASTIAGMIAMCAGRSDGRKLQLSFFLPLFRETLYMWGIGECDVEPSACVGTWQAAGDDKRQASDAGEGQRLGACTVSHPPRAFWTSARVTASAPDDAICRIASPTAIAAAIATLSERRPVRIGMTSLASAASCTFSPAPDDSRPNSRTSPR